METALHEYKKFFDEATVGLCRFDIRSGRCLMANEHCCHMLGYSDEAALLASGETLLKMLGKDEKQALMGRLKREGQVQGYEIRLTSSHRSLWVSAYLHVNCGGSCIQGTLIDITTQKKVEGELESVKAKQITRLAAIREKLDVMIHGYDSDWN